MRAIVEGDIIRSFVLNGGIEVGDSPGKTAGIERLRYDGNKIVDMADVDGMWVEYRNGGFVLHAVSNCGGQFISMRYSDRKRLTLDTDGTIRLLSQAEYDQKVLDEGLEQIENVTLISEIKTFVKNLSFNKIDNHIETVFGGLSNDQKDSLKKLYKAVLILAKRGGVR